jgi:hypothetical protein
MTDNQLDSACVRLGGEQVAVFLDAEGRPVSKWAIRIKGNDGKFRKQTRDEELALAAAPGTRVEREAAFERVMKNFPDGGHQLKLSARRWLPGEREQVVAQLERPSADIDELN